MSPPWGSRKRKKTPIVTATFRSTSTRVVRSDRSAWDMAFISDSTGLVKIALRKILLDQAIQQDEEIPAPHLLDLQLGDTGLAVVPTIGDHRIAVASHNGFQRQLEGQVEMWRKQRLQALDGLPPIELEGVGAVVV